MEFKDLQLFGDRVIVLLDKQSEHTTTAGNIVVPQFVNAESDGGRPIALLSDHKYLATGTVVAISETASDKLHNLSTPISVGDRVYVSPSVVNPSYQFILNRSKLIAEFEGYISISHSLIEAKIITNGN